MKRLLLFASFTAAMGAISAHAGPFSFSTGTPDGLIATLSRPASGGLVQTETADDFPLALATQITGASFFGLIPTGSSVSDITNVEIEFYHVFPLDSANPPSGKVPTRDKSPSDVEIGSATREAAAGTLTFTTTLIGPFAAANSVVNGINPLPGVFTGGEGAVTGQEVRIDVTFTPAVLLPGPLDYFFRPEAELSSGNFLLLSAPKVGTTLFPTDRQTWIRNDNLAPDWLRIGSDITHQGPFNAAFSLSGNTVPEPSTWALMVGGGVTLVGFLRRRKR